MIIAALAAVGLAIFLAGLLAGMAITRQPLEDLLDAWPDERTGSYDETPRVRIVEMPYDWQKAPPFAPDTDLIGHREKPQRGVE